MNKKELRKYLKDTLPDLVHGSPQEQLTRTQVWQTSRHIGLYSAIGQEPPTDSLSASFSEKSFYFPKIIDIQQRLMEFMPMQATWENGPFGILEPPPGKPAQRLDLLVLPGLAFAMDGARLGYGGGFYDRFLGTHKAFADISVGLCYAGQILPTLPVDSWDITVNALCTQNGLIWV